MAGNEVGDRVHNFFAQENFSQGHHPHSVPGNWPSDNNLWVGTDKQVGIVNNSVTQSYDREHSETEVRYNNIRVPVPNGFNFMQKNQSQSQPQNMNGNMYGRQLLQTRPNEANFMGVETDYNQNPRGLFVHEPQQGSVPAQIPNSHRSSDSLNLFRGQPVMNSQHPGFLQPLQQQQTGFSDGMHMQHQLMLKRMQEIRRQKEIQQLNQTTSFARQTSEPFSGHVQRSMGFANQPVDQSLYGVPVSNSRGIIGNSNSFPVSNNWINIDQIQQLNSSNRSESEQDEQPAVEASLDPDEQKILFGSDGNIWDAFGSDKESNLLEDNELGNELPSIQSGSWSALMQSAVSETTSSGNIGVQEELTCLTFQNLHHSQLNNRPKIINQEISHAGGGSGGHYGNLTSNTQQLNQWKQVESSASLNSSDREDLKMHEIDSRSRRENSNDSYQSTSSRQMGLTCGQGQRESPRKFQYHPMRNVNEDVEMSYGKRQGMMNTHAMSLPQHRGFMGQDHQGNFGHAKISGQVSRSSVEVGKGHAPHLPNMFSPVDRSQKASQPSQNMLDLLNKVDQSREHVTSTHINSSEHNLSSEIPKPQYSDGSLGSLQRTQSSNSQGFNLQLGPPSQRLKPLPNTNTSNPRDMGQSQSQTMLPSLPPFQETTTPHNMATNFPSPLGPVFLNSKSQLQFHQPISARRPALTKSPDDESLTSSQLNILESTSLVPQNLEAEKKGNLFLNLQGLASAREQSTKVSFSQNILSAKVDQSQTVIDALPVKPNTTSPIDLEAFGRSLKPSNFNQDSNLMNQMNAMRDIDNDPSNRATKRLKGSDNFSPNQHNDMVPSKDIVVSGQNESQSSLPNNVTTSVNTENFRIGPQMAPSWFERYGTLKSSLLVPGVITVKQPFSEEKLSGGVEVHDKNPASPLVVALDQISIVPTNSGVQNIVSVRPKKRRITTAGLHPWVVEVSGSFKNLQGICTGAVEWSKATNRLMEKVDDDGDIIEDVQPIARPKKRIIFTNLLMQQLLRPPPGVILSIDATSNYENVVYYVARLALGDACNLFSFAQSCSSIPRIGEKCLSDKSEEPEKTETDDHQLSKVIETFMTKSGKLEDDFLRLDNRTSVLDLRMEFLDLERFAVINRFAIFHGRRQPDTSDPDAPPLRPQRYVTAVAFSPNIPDSDSGQCLSL